MPSRKVPLANDEFYHVFNRGIYRRNIFTSAKEFKRALQSLNYYRYQSPPVKLSRYLTVNEKDRSLINLQLDQKPKLVEIVCFCLMNNHFHLLLKQRQDNGITVFMNNFQNSYSRYFNLRNKRQGPLWQGRFKNVRVETDEQLLHLSRYIHLNPFTARMVGSLDELVDYPYSSLGEYVGARKGMCNPEVVLGLFGEHEHHSGGGIHIDNIEKYSTPGVTGDDSKAWEQYRKFVFDQADYQRNLEKVKHLTLE